MIPLSSRFLSASSPTLGISRVTSSFGGENQLFEDISDDLIRAGIIALILFFSVIDALLTLFLINHGAIEVNPIMAFYLNLGPYVFLGVKYGLTSVGLLILLVFRDMFLRPLQMKTGMFFYVILAAFVGVISWQIFLIHKIII